MNACAGPRPWNATVPWLLTIETAVPVGAAFVWALIKVVIDGSTWDAGTSISSSSWTSGQTGALSQAVRATEHPMRTATIGRLVVMGDREARIMDAGAGPRKRRRGSAMGA